MLPMHEYTYRAVNKKGVEEIGTINGHSSNDAMMLLKAAGLILIEIMTNPKDVAEDRR